ncbi:hypothetical protein C5167_032683 [Papaver somniferum]|uniref:Uncharacterized protein n=1 Tax=Papaver somniferum TaxID=3469 RepID=A0A4Y7K9U8_PAPSO|nr:hypothetical protein C5167_032683 [Papaver somniferum]
MHITRSSHSPASSSTLELHAYFIHYPFCGYDGWKDGIGGRGYARNSLILHLNDKHLVNGDEKNALGLDYPPFMMSTMPVSLLCGSCRCGYTQIACCFTLGVDHVDMQVRPCDVFTWVRLLLLLVGVLHLYIPKNSQEEKYGNRKKFQTAFITQWFDPEGCIRLIHKVLLEHQQPNIRGRKKVNQEASNLKRYLD